MCAEYLSTSSATEKDINTQARRPPSGTGLRRDGQSDEEDQNREDHITRCHRSPSYRLVRAVDHLWRARNHFAKVVIAASDARRAAIAEV